MQKNICKICRRLGQKLFLKGEKCFSPRCPIIKRPYPPGLQHKKRRRSFSEYGRELREKQKLKNYYGLSEKQFRGYVEQALKKRGQSEDAGLLLIRMLEKRLDNIVFKMGLAKSRREARQLVSHGHFLVEKKPVNIPSFGLKKDEQVSLKATKESKVIFKNLLPVLKNYQPPTWLKVNKEKLSASIVTEPSMDDVGATIDMSSIFEFYSR